MFGNSAPKGLMHPSRSQQPSPSDRLPEGECRFIFPEAESDGSRQRCICVSFVLNKEVPGSQCGCGHQAWHHVRKSPAGADVVSFEEHHKLFDRFQRIEDAFRRLQDELAHERRERDKSSKELVHLLRGTYNNMAFLRYYVDEKLETLRLHCEDKTEGVLDKAHGAGEEIDKLKARLAGIDETIIRFEERIDSGWWNSRPLTPTPDTAMNASPAPPPLLPEVPAILPIRTDRKHPEAWDVRVILVPRRSQANAFSVNSQAYRRCQSRGLQQDMHLPDQSSAQFVQCVDTSFATILRSRPWVPLMCLRSSEMSLTQIPPVERNCSRWDYQFLESQCMARDKAQGEVIYIALQEVDLSWADIRSLPRVFGSDETCWNYDAELDGPLPEEAALSRMDYKMTLPSRAAAADLKLDSDSVYDYSPPPYSTDIRPSPLGVLAGAATFLADNGPRPRSTPGEVMQTLEEDDEHRDKRTKRGALRPEPQPTGLAPSVSSPPQQPAYYYSGRSKRRITTAKAKEPLDWRPSEMKLGNPAKGLFHRHDKGKAAEQSQQQQQHHQQQQQQQPQQPPQPADQDSRA